MLPELRYSLRRLARSRSFTLTALGCLALGIGVNTAVFSLVNALLLRPFPYPDSERIVFLVGAQRTQGVTDTGVSLADVADWGAGSRVFEDVAGRVERGYTLTGGDLPERVQGSAVTPNLFPMIGVQPRLGRNFRPEEGAAAGFEQGVILSDRLWRRRFAADPGVVGRPVGINGRTLTVLGVMPPDFEFPESDELWVPLARGHDEPRSARYLWGIARLRPGVTLEQAQREVDRVSAHLAGEHPATNRGWTAEVLTFRERLIGGSSQQVLWAMLGAVAFVLLIACANVANLQLARAAARERELSVLSALGASRAQLVRQLVLESLLLSLAGGALGLALAAWCMEGVVALIPERIPYWARMELDHRVLLYTLAVSAVTGLLFGLVPALRSSRADLGSSLRAGARGLAGEGRPGRLRGGLVAAEIALSLVLLVGATLMIKSFLRLQGADPGFDTSRLLTLRIGLTGDRYDPIAARAAFFQEAARRIEALPGVERAVVTSAIPTDDGGRTAALVAEGQPRAAGEELAGSLIGVLPGYFATLRTPLLRGRDFTPAEAADSAATVVIVNQALAARLWPGGAAVGRRLRLGGAENGPWYEVIGVAPDLQYEEFGEDTPQSRLQVHLPYATHAGRQMAVLARSSRDPRGVAAAIRREIRALDATLPTFDVRTMDEVRLYTTWPQRLFGSVFGAFAVVALLLAAVGVYGVMSYTVSQRVREIGIRMALGAARRDVLRLVVGHGAGLTALGIGAGLLGAYALTRLLAAGLYGVSATDPLAFAATTLLLAAIALLACWLPARRATRVDPMVALRSE